MSKLFINAFFIASFFGISAHAADACQTAPASSLSLATIIQIAKANEPLCSPVGGSCNVQMDCCTGICDPTLSQCISAGGQ